MKQASTSLTLKVYYWSSRCPYGSRGGARRFDEPVTHSISSIAPRTTCRRQSFQPANGRRTSFGAPLGPAPIPQALKTLVAKPAQRLAARLPTARCQPFRLMPRRCLAAMIAPMRATLRKIAPRQSKPRRLTLPMRRRVVSPAPFPMPCSGLDAFSARLWHGRDCRGEAAGLDQPSANGARRAYGSHHWRHRWHIS